MFAFSPKAHTRPEQFISTDIIQWGLIKKHLNDGVPGKTSFELAHSQNKYGTSSDLKLYAVQGMLLYSNDSILLTEIDIQFPTSNIKWSKVTELQENIHFYRIN